VNVTIKPAPSNHGIKFIRTDLLDCPDISAHFNMVVDTSLATVIGYEGFIVSTIEHLMASFAGHERAMQKSQVDLDRPFLAAMDELVDIRIVGAVNLACRPVPHDLALVDHRDVVGDLAG